jgi:hypothetical protein
MIPMVWLVDGTLLVPAESLSGLVREVAAEVSGWEDEGPDPATVQAVERMLQSLADQIDVDCIALVSRLDPHPDPGTEES